jgi:2'-5' RNA ligase
MSSIRTFIAIETPADVRAEMVRVQEILRASEADVRWETPDKFHITIRFLGNIEESKLGGVVSKIESVAGSFHPFPLVYESVGAFPNIGHPNIVWIGSQNPDGTLVRLKDALDRGLQPYGFEIEKRAFHPHVTLGRVKGQRGIRDLTRILEKCTFEPRSATVGGIFVMRSMLKPQGAEYSLVRSIPLPTA